MRKLYIVQKYIWAETPIEAILKEKEFPADEVYLNNNWMVKPGTEENKGFLDPPSEEEKKDEKN